MKKLGRSSIMRFPRRLPERYRGGACTLGNFDGIHRGHVRVLSHLQTVAQARTTAVVSFYPHPINILRGSGAIRSVTSVREKAERLGELGVNLLYCVHFTQKLALCSADEFIKRVFIEALGVSDLVVGEDVGFGHGKRGDLQYLTEKLPGYGIKLHTVPRLDIDGRKAGSRLIRELVEGGLVEEVVPLLGAPFTISARVGHGDKRGSQIGFPTANISVGTRLIPRRGVYACRVEVDGDYYGAVANIGVRPTFNGDEERLEVHILDFPARSLYGTRIHVSFVSRLRDEQGFSGVELLVEQINRDIKQARVRLNHER